MSALPKTATACTPSPRLDVLPPRRGARRLGVADDETRLALLARGFAQLYLEVEAGWRPRSQLARLMTPRLYGRLLDGWVRPGAPGRVVRVRGVLAGPGRYEAVVVVRRPGRFGAVALSLVRSNGAWRVHDAVRPEDGATRPHPECVD
ncbi:MAG: hypothetical protein KY434_07525 [Actinobacteria bacterium]|nr:hypothetical protein [Actinomycetota bacterium]